VLIDQRGTGRSAPLCVDDEAAAAPLRESADLAAAEPCAATLPQALQAAAARRPALQYTTAIAMAGRRRGARRRSAPGAHQPGRRVVRHAGGAGVPAPVSAGGAARGARRAWRRPTWRCRDQLRTDNQAALDALLAACDGRGRLQRAAYPPGAAVAALLASLPREVTLHAPADRQATRR
jgi:hypothetical protein